jgi:hypothetical protein
MAAATPAHDRADYDAGETGSAGVAERLAAT